MHFFFLGASRPKKKCNGNCLMHFFLGASSENVRKPSETAHTSIFSPPSTSRRLQFAYWSPNLIEMYKQKWKWNWNCCWSGWFCCCLWFHHGFCSGSTAGSSRTRISKKNLLHETFWQSSYVDTFSISSCDILYNLLVESINLWRTEW